MINLNSPTATILAPAAPKTLVEWFIIASLDSPGWEGSYCLTVAGGSGGLLASESGNPENDKVALSGRGKRSRTNVENKAPKNEQSRNEAVQYLKTQELANWRFCEEKRAEVPKVEVRDWKLGNRYSILPASEGCSGLLAHQTGNPESDKVALSGRGKRSRTNVENKAPKNGQSRNEAVQ